MVRIIVFVSVSLLATSLASPAGVYVGKNGEVGASWGGYSASAGLGGVLSGGGGAQGGLHAEAGTPDGHFAAAGLGGAVGEGGAHGGLGSVATTGKKPVVVLGGGGGGVISSSSSASSSVGVVGGHKPVVRPQGTFFDDIFNIPISVLGAVNQYLNNRKPGTVVVGGAAGTVQAKPVHTKHYHHHNAPAPAAAASVSASSSASSAAAAGPPASIDNTIPTVHKQPNYNDIFNIPISVLGAVNKLLNNGK